MGIDAYQARIGEDRELVQEVLRRSMAVEKGDFSDLLCHEAM